MQTNIKLFRDSFLKNISKSKLKSNYIRRNQRASESKSTNHGKILLPDIRY